MTLRLCLLLMIPSLASAANGPDFSFTPIGAPLFPLIVKPDANAIYSPASISFALAHVSAAAKGETESELSQALFRSKPSSEIQTGVAKQMSLLRNPSEGVTFRIAGGIWVDDKTVLTPEFEKVSSEVYGAVAERISFTPADVAAKKINGWVEEKTEHNIKDLLDPSLLQSAAQVLVNAVYFKGLWQHPFDKNATRPGPFSLESGEKVDVPLMGKTFSIHYFESEGTRAGLLPYGKTGDFAMLAILPAKGDTPAHAVAKIGEIFEKTAKAGMKETRVVLPRFKIESSYMLKEPLQKVGIQRSFTSDAEFPGLGGTFIDTVIHKAFVEVQEEGTEAAAATAVVMTRAALQKEQPQLVLDRPFAFAVVHVPTRSILFLGQVVDPR